MTTVAPQCMFCRRFHVRNEGGNTCDAFPDGIPVAIILNRFDHRDPHDGDHGIRFAPLPGERHPMEETT